ncbi:MAG: DegT/DnrJ/EryC1/StrS family aminotransferase [Vitreoscilla sp.]|nr:DegT/DnrJ/EryC1/StrS family aminotransferase [Polaromonas sp.]
MTEPFIVFGAPDILDAEIQEVLATLQSGWIGTGPRVAEFESQMASFKGMTSPHAVALNSCTAALHLSLLAAGVGPGDEVITSPLTFCATINAILYTGATPVLADVDPLTMNLDPAQIRRKITAKTRVLLPVHFAGLPCDMDAIGEIAATHQLQIIEDCAHAAEATYRGRPVGTFGDYGCFSFYATKNITTGEGGMVLARDPERARYIKMMSLHGMSQDAWNRFSSEGYKHYQVVDCGFKYNMMDMQAAIGIHQLARVEAAWVKRQTIWNRYQNAFAGLPLVCPAELPPHTPISRHAHHLYTVLVDEQRCGVSRDQFLTRMTRLGIGVGVHYLAIPEHTYYQQRLGCRPADTPHATRIGRQTLSLPISPKLTDDEVERVIKAVGLCLA